MIPISLMNEYWIWPVLSVFYGLISVVDCPSSFARLLVEFATAELGASLMQSSYRARYSIQETTHVHIRCPPNSGSDNILSRLYYIIIIDVFSTSGSMHHSQTCNAIKTFSWVSFDLKNSGMLIRLMTRPKLKLYFSEHWPV